MGEVGVGEGFLLEDLKEGRKRKMERSEGVSATKGDPRKACLKNAKEGGKILLSTFGLKEWIEFVDLVYCGKVHLQLCCAGVPI